MTVTLTATPKQMETALAAVIPYASDDRSLPVLQVVSIELFGTTLIAAATNRYVMGVYKADPSDWDDQFKPIRKPLTVNVFGSDLRRLFTFVRVHKNEPVQWTFAPDKVSVDINGEGISVRTVTGIEFVNWRAIYTDRAADQPGTIAALGIAPEWTGLLVETAKQLIGRTGYPIEFHLGRSGLRPIMVKIGEHFTGLLMPIRMPEENTLDLGPLLARPAAPAIAS